MNKCVVMTPCYHDVRKPHLLDTQGLYTHSGLTPRLRCLWVQVGLAKAFMLCGRQVNPSTMWHACSMLVPAPRTATFWWYNYKHTRTQDLQGEVAIWIVHMIAGETRLKARLRLVSNAATHSCAHFKS